MYLLPHKLRLLKRWLFRKSKGEKIIKANFKKFYSKELDIKNPLTFSEKLFTRMVMVNRHGDKRFTRLADKFLTREYVREKIGEQYLVGLIWNGANPDEIPFDKLPSKCLIKTNHGSGGNIVFDKTVTQNEVMEKMQKWLGENFYWVNREYHYYDIPRQILIEQFLDDEVENGPLDYRFWCFHGKPEIIQIDNYLHDINPFYDANWNKLDLCYRENLKCCEIQKPETLQEMLDIASKLSADFDFVRVDLYSVKSKVYFGELTFTPVAGQFTFKPEFWNVLLGQKWDLE